MPVLRPSLALDLFTRIMEGDSVALLRAMVDEEPRAVENEWREFKAFPVGNFRDPAGPYEPRNFAPGKSDFIKETWSKTLSAFANAGGGVLIWGIYAAGGGDGVDEAKEFKLVPNPKALASRLMTLHHEATDPPLEGVKAEAVEDPGEGGKGFVVCYVPQGDFPPYRAEHCQNQYYYRIGDDSIVAPREMLRRLFYPQSLSRVVVLIRVQLLHGMQGSQHTLTLRHQISVRNDGNATAREVHLIAIDDVPYGVTGGLLPSEWSAARGSKNRSAVDLRGPLHPGQTSEVATSYDWRIGRHRLIGERVLPEISPVHMRFEVFSRDAEPRIFVTVIRQEDFDAADTVERECTLLLEKRDD